MLIDLHCHTKKIKKGDSIGRTVTPKMFAEKIEQANVKIVAITNHNHFDCSQYVLLRKAVDKSCLVWPGVELDVSGKDCSRAHLIIVANPECYQQFSNSVENLVGDSDVNTCVFPVQSVVCAFENCDPIFIPHYHGKNPAFPDTLIDELVGLVKDKTRVFRELSDYRSLGIYANHEFNVIIGSDNQGWKDYENCTFADIRLEVDCYSKFCLLAKKDSTVVNTLLNSKKNDMFVAYPHPDNRIQLKIFRDINIIFGQKGTGKSEILDSLRIAFEKAGIKTSMYKGSQKEGDFDKLLDTTSITRDHKKLGIPSLQKEFKTIVDWKDLQPEQLQNYILWQETKNKSKNKQRMQITNAYALPSIDTKDRDKHKDSYALVSNLVEGINGLDLTNYIVQDDIDLLLSLLRKLNESVYSRYLSEWVKVEAVTLVNFSISNIKQKADRSTESVSIPSSTGFVEFANNRLTLLSAVESIIKAFDTPPFLENEPIGNLDDKGELYLQTRMRLLCDESDRHEYSGNIRKLKTLKQNICGIEKRILNDNLSDSIVKLKEDIAQAEVTTISDFIGIKKCVVDESNYTYNPSNGEKGILMLQRMLKEPADYYILDELELGMGNSYINNTILPKIINLGKEQKAVVIATHNANIAVRTMPYMTILRTHQNGIYRTYSGNPFTDKLVNIDDEDDVKSWTIESMNTLEGGRVAFYERMGIYESGETSEKN